MQWSAGRPAGRDDDNYRSTKACVSLPEYIPVYHAAPKAGCIDLYLIALTQLHTPIVMYCVNAVHGRSEALEHWGTRELWGPPTWVPSPYQWWCDVVQVPTDAGGPLVHRWKP